jgi:acetylornithine deacetylase/succinyl-diaminopimelate desuccinylase-like protein
MQPSRHEAHPLLGAASYNIGTIRGGVSRNTVPDRCIFEIEKRFLPGDDPAQIRAEIETIVEQTLGTGHVELVREPGYSQIPHLPLHIAPEHPLVRALVRAIEDATGRPAEVAGWPAFTDGAVLQALGTPAVVFGPGSLAMAHADDERVEVAELAAAMQVYVRLALNLCDLDSEVSPRF